MNRLLLAVIAALLSACATLRPAPAPAPVAPAVPSEVMAFTRHAPENTASPVIMYNTVAEVEARGQVYDTLGTAVYTSTAPYSLYDVIQVFREQAVQAGAHGVVRSEIIPGVVRLDAIWFRPVSPQLLAAASRLAASPERWVGDRSTRTYVSTRCGNGIELVELSERTGSRLTSYATAQAAARAGLRASTVCSPDPRNRGRSIAGAPIFRGGGTSPTNSSGGIPSASGSSGGCTGDCSVNVRGYRRKDGTYVRPHTRSRPGTRSSGRRSRGD